MKILIINGTPQLKGVTHSFVLAAHKAIQDAGAEADEMNLSKMNLTKCKMCYTGWGICFEEHKCVFGDKDGFNDLQKRVEEADAYIYITPVYWGEVSEEMKLFIDKLRRCQATKKWDRREDENSFLIGKPSILVAVAGGGGGGILTTLQAIERAITQMGGDGQPREKEGIFDYIGVNRWNQDFKRDAFYLSVKEMIAIKRGEKEAPDMDRTQWTVPKAVKNS